MSVKSQTVRDFTVSWPSQILWIIKWKLEILDIPDRLGMNGDKSGESGAFLFSRHVSDFCDGRRSFPTNEKSNLYRPGHRHPSAMDFAHYQFPCWAPVPLSRINNLFIIGKIRSPSPGNGNEPLGKSGTDLWRISDLSAKSGVVGKE